MNATPPHSPSTTLTYDNWQQRAQDHTAAVRKFTVPTRERRSRAEKHPILDFLSTYYSLSLGRLEKWHPGTRFILESGSHTPAHLTEKHYTLTPEITLDPSKITTKEHQRLTRIRNLLAFTQSRTPYFACYGLHEWAMLYKGIPADIRHRESAPLRVPQQQIDHLVETHPIACSHFDAYRHFTPPAHHLNLLQPTLDTREENEQPGCIHANMDLYKWAYKCMPWIGSDLLHTTFLFALQAREIDMRATPYDLTAYGYQPLKIETPEGRNQYKKEQQKLTQQAHPLRQQLIHTIDNILQISTPTEPES